MSHHHYDVAIIGGGINGAGIARELSLRNFSVVLVEMKDFGSGTSCRSSKLAHGGLRYLENFQFNLVHEACIERSRLLHNAGHIVKPLPFLFPIYDKGPYSRLKVGAGLWLYDALALYKNIDRHQWLTKTEVLSLAPHLEAKGLKGAMLYYDAKMDDSRLCLEAILQAHELGAQVYNYHKVTKMESQDNKVTHMCVHDCINNQDFSIMADLYISATGPWSNSMLSLLDKTKEKMIRPTKGVHIVVKKIIDEQALILPIKDDKRLFFMIPWDEYTIIGTTDTDYTGDINNVRATDDDIRYILNQINRYFPTINLTTKSIVSTFAGLRPLITSKNQDTKSVSREHQLLHVNDNLWAIVGGKYTTFRHVSERVAEAVQKRLRQTDPFESLSETLPFPGGEIDDIDLYIEENYIIDNEIYQLDKAAYTQIINQYGSQYKKVLDTVCEDISYKKPLTGTTHLKGEVIYAIRYEFARKLDDFMRRRTWLSLKEHNGLQCLDEVADLFSEELSWNEQEKQNEKQTYYLELGLL